MAKSSKATPDRKSRQKFFEQIPPATREAFRKYAEQFRGDEDPPVTAPEPAPDPAPPATAPAEHIEQQAQADDQPNDGWQAERVKVKLDQLVSEGIVVQQKTRLELRRLIEAKFETERKAMLQQGLAPPPIPSRKVINAVIRKYQQS
jgi:hypothetical protein